MQCFAQLIIMPIVLPIATMHAIDYNDYGNDSDDVDDKCENDNIKYKKR